MFRTISQPPATITPPSPFSRHRTLSLSVIHLRTIACARPAGAGRVFPPLSLSLSSIFPTHRSLSTVQSEGREESTNIAEPRSRELSPSPSSTTYPQSSPPSLQKQHAAKVCVALRSPLLRQAGSAKGERGAAECVVDVGRSPVCLGRPPPSRSGGKRCGPAQEAAVLAAPLPNDEQFGGNGQRGSGMSMGNDKRGNGARWHHIHPCCSIVPYQTSK